MFAILVEVCGGPDRARFWAAYACVFTVLTPLMAISKPGLLDAVAAQGSAGLVLQRAVFYALAGVALGLLLAGQCDLASDRPRPARAAQHRRGERAMSAVAVIGARGFVGRNVVAALEARGATVRRPARPECDLVCTPPEDLARGLAGVEVVVNTVGALAGPLEAVHLDGVRNPIQACRHAGVRRLVHVSAIGSAPGGATRYWRTKGAAESLLYAITEFDDRIVRPALVVGPGGASTALFSALSALPVVPRVPSGPLRPVALDDLVETIARTADFGIPTSRRVDAVGPDVMVLDSVVKALGAWLGTCPFGRLALGAGPLSLLARVGGALGVGPMNAEALAMLSAGATGDVASTIEALGRRFTPSTLPALRRGR
jgi:uncharacterized protein YbjT (DUF2867 family)